MILSCHSTSLDLSVFKLTRHEVAAQGTVFLPVVSYSENTGVK